MTTSKNLSSSRRDFIKKTAAGTLGAGLAMSMPASSYARILGANDRVRVGIVGYSNRAQGSLIPAFLQHASDQNMEITAVSDIWNMRREQGAAELSEKTEQKVKPMRNNEELYESGEVDAVIISTADFQHALHAIQAVEAGCDLYCEKPFANTMEDNNAALKVIEGSDRVFQIGTQRRSAPNYQRAAEYIQSGEFGPVVMAEMSWNVNQPGRWRRPALVAAIEKEDTDWERYLMNRPYEEWDPRKYLEYRLFWPYSSGIPDQWMVHQIDTVHWFTGLPRPRSVAGNGGIYAWDDGRRNFDTMTAVFDYGPLGLDPLKGEGAGEGFQVVYSSRQTNSAGGVKEIYYSNGGALNLDVNKVTPEGGLEERHASAMEMEPNLLPEMELAGRQGVETAADTGADNATSLHMLNWMECLRSREETNGPIRAAYNHSVALCMTIAALQTGQRIAFDDEAGNVVIGA